MDRVFLDANVLFSAAWRENAGLVRLWSVTGIKLISSAYALAEARRNLKAPAQVGRLDALAAQVELVNEAPPDAVLPGGASLPDKDAPILLAAIHAQATHLLAGDRRHFGPYFGMTVAGVRIEVPATYLTGKLNE